MKEILFAVAVLGGMGLLFGLVLAIASKVFAVETNPLLEPLIETLPGANCGGCGFSGCAGYAQAILDGKAEPGSCAAGGKACAEAMAKVLGIEPVETVRTVAYVQCTGVHAKDKGQYEGLQDCIAASRVAGKGPKVCEYGCLGFGNCTQKCQFDAIHIVDGVAKVDPERCVGCMACASVCPRQIIRAIPYGSKVTLPCSSHAKGPVVMKACDVGCIGCMKCAKTCTHDAIHVTDGLAAIDYNKCVGCGECAAVCPRHLILNLAQTSEIS